MASAHRLIDHIRSMEKMTPSEAKIADFFIREHQRIAFESVTSIGEKCRVSKATVARFIVRLGYENFQDFQEKVQAELLDRLQSPMERFSRRKQDGEKKDYLELALSAATRNIEEARTSVPREHFDRAVEWLSDAAGSVYVMGLLSSYGLAWVFWIMGNYLRPNVHLLAHTGALPNQLINAGPDDALLAVSHRRYARQTTLAMRHVGQRGGRVILVTDSELSPPARFADLVLVVPGSAAVTFDSGCATLAVLEALAEAMSERLEASLFGRLEVMDRLFEDFEAFAPGPDYPLTGRVPRKNRIS